ncbi:hypothetical protein CDEF62S_01597 [Castellaniella defragrans]
MRRLHLLGRRQVGQPDLETAQQAVLLLRHLFVDDAAPGRHPLYAARLEIALVAQVIAMAHVAVDDVGDRLEAPMGVRRKTRDVVLRIVGRKRIQHQKRVHADLRLIAQGPQKAHAGAILRGLRRGDASD